MRTFVYIDGFNLYYRLLKANPQWRWLNIAALSAEVLREENIIVRVNYYTARVSGRLKPGSPARQRVYLDALATVPEVKVHFGNFLINTRWAGLVHPPRTQPALTCQMKPPYPDLVKVWKTEEKGSDVNLGCHLVRDACTKAFDVAAVLSNDTNLVELIRIVTRDLSLPVGLMAPVNKPAQGLKDVASFVRFIRPGHLKRSQFAHPLPGSNLTRQRCTNPTQLDLHPRADT